MENHNYAVIGLGKFGQKRVKSLTNSTNEMNLQAVYDNDKNQAAANIENLKSFNEVLDKDEIKNIILSTPNNTHYDYLKALIIGEKNILCEKPLCTNKDEILKIKRLLESYPKANLQMGSNLSYFPALMKMKELLTQNYIGELEEITSSIGHNGDYTKEGWHSNKSLSGGGCLIDNGIHLLTYFHSFLTDLNLVESHLQYDDSEVEVDASIQLTSKECKRIKLHSSWRKNQGYCEIQVIGARGILKVNALEDQVILIRQGSQEVIECAPSEPSIEKELKLFNERIITGEKLYPAIDDIEKISEIIFAVYDSSEN
jgi:predicted dehydrogenase